MSFAQSTQNENPYQAPRKQSPHDGQWLGEWREGASATLVSHGLLYRKIAITAPIEATLEFIGRNYCWDMVRVDGNVVAWKISWWRINPQLDFQLPVGDSLVPGRVTLRLWPWLAFRRFRVEIAGRVVYQEPAREPASDH
jgi:hypothetical protein